MSAQTNRARGRLHVMGLSAPNPRPYGLRPKRGGACGKGFATSAVKIGP
jgi:hypothetical protein